MKIILIFLLIGFADKLWSEDLRTVHLFIKELLKQQHQLDPNFDYWQGASMKQPPGGYLYRFYFDVTGDGVKEIFLSSSLNSDRRSASWDVFKKEEENNFKQIAKEINFHPEAFYFKQTPSSGVITVVTGRPVDGGFNIYKYNFTSLGEFSVSSTFKEIKDVEIADFNYEEWLQSLDLGQLVTNQNIEKILLGEFCKNPKIQWREYDRKHSVPQQYLDPADAEDIKSVENFTPQEAQRLIGQWEQKESATNNPPLKTSSIPSDQTQTNRVSQTTLETKSSKQVIIWGIIAILGLGLIIIFILKRKPEL